jgi:FtsH-binding integral membrane protein
MFIGHFGAGFAGKKFEKSASLGTYFMAAQWIDLIWPILLLLGVEKAEIKPGVTSVTPLDFTYYPFTHSLFGVIVWAVLFAMVYFLIKKNSRTAIILGLIVLSHWFLDLLVHIPDLPIFPGYSLKVGFGIWNNFALTIIVEGLVFVIGTYIYFKITKPKNKIGIYSLVGLIIFLVAMYISNLIGSPPPSVEAIGIIGNAQWLIIIWGYWIDKNRESHLAGKIMGNEK